MKLETFEDVSSFFQVLEDSNADGMLGRIIDVGVEEFSNYDYLRLKIEKEDNNEKTTD